MVLFADYWSHSDDDVVFYDDDDDDENDNLWDRIHRREFWWETNSDGVTTYHMLWMDHNGIVHEKSWTNSDETNNTNTNTAATNIATTTTTSTAMVDP
jgi:hypothetical protein